jgi:predicted nuclease of predicted toxin-antitoxin system
VKLLIDEHLSPGLVARCAQKGVYAVAVAHVGLAGQRDDELWQYALENDFVVVTANTRDFMNLLDTELHPGLIILWEGSLSRDEQWHRLDLALDRILRNASPAGFMVNRVVEVISAREIRVREILQGQAGQS